MIRFLMRAFGYMLLAGAFVTVVIDGTRTVAAGNLILTSVRQTLDRLAPSVLAAVQPAIEGVHATLWDPVTITAMKAPLALALVLVSVLFLGLGGERRPVVGYEPRR
ncbi:MAG: hypothetical protein ACOYOJ_22615 [Alsobacter sp.]